MFFPCRLFKPSLMFPGMESNPLLGKLAANIILGCKGLSGTNTLAYIGTIVNYGHAKFYNIGS